MKDFVLVLVLIVGALAFYWILFVELKQVNPDWLIGSSILVSTAIILWSILLFGRSRKR